MVRGQASKVGDTRVSANGYHYTKTPDKWKLTHHIVAEEEILRRQLKENERVIFRDKNRQNLDPTNLAVVIKGSGSASRTKARLTARIQELTAQLEELN